MVHNLNNIYFVTPLRGPGPRTDPAGGGAGQPQPGDGPGVGKPGT